MADFRQIIFTVPPAVHLLDLTGPAHIFYEVRAMELPVTVAFASMGDRADAVSSAGLAFSKLVDFRDTDLKKGDYIFLPGLESALLLSGSFYTENQAFFEWIRTAAEKGVRIASVCTGAFLLAATGLLDGRACTTHWKYYKAFRKMYPKAGLLENRLFTESDGLLTSAGVASGIDLALYIVEQEYGTTVAGQVAREVVVYHRRGQDDPQLSMYLQYRNHLNDRVHRVQEYLNAHLEDKCTLHELAGVAGTSSRNLTRLFKETTGITVGRYHEKLRAEEALRLSELGHTRESIAAACGLSSTNQVRHIINKYGQQI
ncbi:MAG: DJ-1/PfpI family protein [Cyclobacteriaceae bacterium]